MNPSSVRRICACCREAPGSAITTSHSGSRPIVVDGSASEHRRRASPPRGARADARRRRARGAHLLLALDEARRRSGTAPLPSVGRPRTRPPGGPTRPQPRSAAVSRTTCFELGDQRLLGLLEPLAVGLGQREHEAVRRPDLADARRSCPRPSRASRAWRARRAAGRCGTWSRRSPRPGPRVVARIRGGSARVASAQVGDACAPARNPTLRAVANPLRRPLFPDGEAVALVRRELTEATFPQARARNGARRRGP